MNQELLFIWYFPQSDGCFKIIDKAASKLEILRDVNFYVRIFFIC